jgi:uncharacterized RDD family membrane protein YckC
VSGDQILSFSDQADGIIQTPADDRIRIDTPEQISLDLPLAGVGSRFMAIAVDTLLQILLYIGTIFAMAALSKYGPSLPSWAAVLPGSWLAALMILFMFSIYWGYFAFFEIIWKGQTPGKRLAKIRVIKNSGRGINVYEAIGRNLLRVIDWLPGMYVVGIITILISRRNQRLGDHLVGSIVVHEKATEEFRPDWISATESAPSDPQLSKITPEELVLIETYLQRRDTLELGFRDATAQKIAARIIQKTGVERPANQSLDDFLQAVARKVRDSARLR